MPYWNVETEALLERYERIRDFTEELCEPLEIEDHVVQSMPDASPAKWHLAHTTWFFERFILQEQFGAEPVDERYNFIFNSYYNAAGDQFSRPDRGVLSRPTVGEIYDYRSQVDARMGELLTSEEIERPETAAHVDLGLHHEQQHQELLVTDMKHMFGQNPLHPEVVDEREPAGRNREAGDLRWRDLGGGECEVGYGGDDFAFDNERPRHTVRQRPFQLASRPVTCGEYVEFIEDGGYERVELWLSDGWATVQERGWDSPMYWKKVDGDWHIYTLAGLRQVDPHEPLAHVSYYEADAFAEWAGARLPTEQEWEIAAQAEPLAGHFAESGRRHPARRSGDENGELSQMFGDVWEWTASAYSPYPGFERFPGKIGEYNGKFMCNQYVLRGGSCATPESHIRRTYRNFFYPHSRWQFSGFRLARDA